jgi:hypothetical protein
MFLWWFTRIGQMMPRMVIFSLWIIIQLYTCYELLNIGIQVFNCKKKNLIAMNGCWKWWAQMLLTKRLTYDETFYYQIVNLSYIDTFWDLFKFYCFDKNHSFTSSFFKIFIETFSVHLKYIHTLLTWFI